MSAVDVIELLVYLDPPEAREEAEREGENIVMLLVRAGYDAAITDYRNEDS